MRGTSKKLTKTSLILCGLLSAFMAFQTAKIISYSNNTLQNHPEWVSGKLNVFRQYLMGGEDTFYSRHILQRNRLNVHTAFGFNLIDLNRVFQPSLIAFDFFLGENAYLAFLFNKTFEGFSGIRVSRNPKFKNMSFHADASGRFTEVNPLSIQHVGSGWHHMELRFIKNSLLLSVDKRLVTTIKISPLKEQIIGFRSGIKECLVKHLFIKDIDQNIIPSSFENDRHTWILFLSSYAFIFSFSLLLLIIFDKKYVFYLHYLTILGLAAYYDFDYTYWSAQYFSTNFHATRPFHQPPSSNSFEERRAWFFNKFNRLDPTPPNYSSRTNPEPLSSFLHISMEPGNEKDADFQIFINDRPPQFQDFDKSDAVMASLKKEFHKSSDFVTCFLGSSQTWGAGASKEEDLLAFQFHKRMVSHDKDKHNIITLNLSRSAYTSTEILQRYKTLTTVLIPHLTIVNLSNNDNDPAVFRQNLESLAKFNEEHHVRTVFTLEPNSLERRLTDIQLKHQIMRSVAATHHLLCLDLHSFFQRDDIYDSGFIWWDFVHLTSYGQRLAAEFIWNGIQSDTLHAGKTNEPGKS